MIDVSLGKGEAKGSIPFRSTSFQGFFRGGAGRFTHRRARLRAMVWHRTGTVCSLGVLHATNLGER